MANNSTVKKLLQVSEQAAPVVHVPIMVGNELFVLTQQDIRRVEDIRLLSYSRLTPQGQLLPIDTPVNSFYAQQPATQVCPLQDLISHFGQRRLPQHPGEEHEMKVPATGTVASIATQVNWSKTKNSSSPFPLRYSAATSTSGLQQHENVSCQHCPRRKNRHTSCQTCATTAAAACNTCPEAIEESQKNSTCTQWESREMTDSLRFNQPTCGHQRFDSSCTRNDDESDDQYCKNQSRKPFAHDRSDRHQATTSSASQRQRRVRFVHKPMPVVVPNPNYEEQQESFGSQPLSRSNVAQCKHQ